MTRTALALWPEGSYVESNTGSDLRSNLGAVIALCTGILMLGACSSNRSGLLEGLESPQAAATANSDSAPVVPVRSTPDLPPPAPPSETDVIAALLAKGSEGSEESADEALIKAEAYAATESGPLADAYLGASTLLAAKFAGNPFSKLGKARTGLALLDSAVKARPTDPEVRYLRASTSFPLPTFLGYRETSESDLAWLLERIQTPHPFLTARRQSLVHLYSGIVARDAKDLESARIRFKSAVDVAPDTAPGRRAQQELQDLPEAH